MVGITITTSRMTSPHFIYHYFPAGEVLEIKKLIGKKTFYFSSRSLFPGLVLFDDPIMSQFGSSWSINSHHGFNLFNIEVVKCDIKHRYLFPFSCLSRSVKAQLPFYNDPTFLEVYLGLTLTLVTLLFLQTLYLILRCGNLAIKYVYTNSKTINGDFETNETNLEQS